MTDRLYDRLVFAFLLTVILCQALFAAFPGLDLAVSAHFANGRGGFGWAEGLPAMINPLLRHTGELVAVALVLWCFYGGLTGLLRPAALRAWAFAALTVVLASGAVVNLLLKTHVGRARPAHITEFGGTAQFTPAWQVTDQCSRNCSFSSGEVSLAASLAIVAVVLLWPRLKTSETRIAALLTAEAYVGIVSVLRIGLGRHFFSDVVFSLLFSGAVALVLYRVLQVRSARLTFDPNLPILVMLDRIRDSRAFLQAWLKKPT